MLKHSVLTKESGLEANVTEDDPKLVVPAADLEAILVCQVDSVRSFLEQNETNENTQLHLAELISQLAALYRIFLQNKQYPASKSGYELGTVMRAAFGFLQQPSNYNGSPCIGSLLNLYPEWQGLTGVTLAKFRAGEKLAEYLEALRATSVPASST